MFYKLRRGIHNIIRYLPVIWDDEDFDYEPIYKLLYYKLKFIEEFHRGNRACSIDSNKIANKIKIAKVLAKRLWKDDYLENALKDYNNKWGNTPLFNSIPQNNGKLFKLEDRNKKQSKDFSKGSKHSDYMERQDREYLFNYLKKYIREFWD